MYGQSGPLTGECTIVRPAVDRYGTEFIAVVEGVYANWVIVGNQRLADLAPDLWRQIEKAGLLALRVTVSCKYRYSSHS